MFKSGFITLFGQPNAGKSTLLNALIKEKVAIVSDKAQTTRNMIRGILNQPEYQLVFIDTPGLHQPKDEFGRYLNKTSYSALEGVEIIYFVADATRHLNKIERKLIEDLKNYKNETKIFCVINKVDLFSKNELIKIVLDYQESLDFDAIIPISAQQQDNLEKLLALTLENIPESIPFFSDEDFTDNTLSFTIREIIREKVLFTTFQEIPHSIVIDLDHVVDTDDSLSIIASIIVNKPSQKPIIIGKNGAMISKIRQLARRDLKQKFNKNIELELFVKVDESWRHQLKRLKELGYQNE